MRLAIKYPVAYAGLLGRLVPFKELELVPRQSSIDLKKLTDEELMSYEQIAMQGLLPYSRGTVGIRVRRFVSANMTTETLSNSIGVIVWQECRLVNVAS